MGQSSDQLRQEIDRKRSDATDKIGQLQGQVEGSAQQVRDQVQDTVGQVQDSAEHVREQVRGTMEDTVETIRNVDYQQQIQDRPLLALGAAFLGGFVLGSLGGGGNGDRGGGSSGGGQHHDGSGGIAGGLRTAAQKSGFDEVVSNASAALMGSVTSQVRGTLDRSLPGFADRMTTAQQQPGSVADKAKATQSTS